MTFLFALLLASRIERAPIAKVPFGVFDDHVYVSARVNGKGPFLLNIDTGGSMELSSELATSLGLRAVGKIVGGGAGSEESEYGRISPCDIKVGDIEIKKLDAMVSPPSSAPRLTAGLGRELFKHYTLEFDYDNNELKIFRPGELPQVAGYSKLPMEIYNGMPLVTLTVAGVKGKFTLDTGGGISTIVQRDFWKQNGLDQRLGFRERQKISAGIGGDIFGYTAAIPEIRVEGVSLLDVRGTFSDMDKGSLVDPLRNGTIGQRILKQFNQIYDYAGGYVYLKPNSSFVQKLRWEALGCYLVQLGKDAYVGTVPPKSIAEELGLRRNDQVVCVNGSICRSINDVSKVGPGERIEILREGEVISILIK